MASASSLLHLHLPSLVASSSSSKCLLPNNFLSPRLFRLRPRSYVRSAVEGEVSVIDPLPSTSDSADPNPQLAPSFKLKLPVFQRIDVFSKDFDNIVELDLGAPWPLPPVEVTATLAHKFEITEKLRSRPRIMPQTRRHLVGVSLFAILTLTPLPVWAQEKEEGEENEGVIGAIKSLFDPDEKTKSGKVLPKAYLKSAREVVKTLRESLEEDPKDNAKFRRTADAAKGPIRDYLSNWRGQQKVASEESYAIFEKVIRSLAGFYSKAGPSAPLPQDLKSQILDYLNKAEEFL